MNLVESAMEVVQQGDQIQLIHVIDVMGEEKFRKFVHPCSVESSKSLLVLNAEEKELS